MKNTLSKTTTIIVILTLSVAMLIAVLPFTNAQLAGPDGEYSVAFIGVNPKIVGIHEQILVTGWTSPVHPTPIGSEIHFKQGYVVTFTKPDGSTEDIDPLAGYPNHATYEEGSFFVHYTPDQIGQWSCVLYWPGDEIYAPSTSEPYTFEVAAEPVYGPPEDIPLPIEYWSQPLPGDIRGASGYVSNWLEDGYNAGEQRWNPYSRAPNSAHILWNVVEWDGGVIGGEYGDLSAVDAYSIGAGAQGVPILMGRAYIQPHRADNKWHCLDLATGEELWAQQFDGNVFLAVQPYQDQPHYRGIWPVIYNAINGERVDVLSALSPDTNVSGSFTGGYVVDPMVGISDYHEGYLYYTGQGHLLKWQPNVSPDPQGHALNVSSSFTTFVWVDKIKYRVPRPAGVPAPSYYDGDIGIASGARAAYNLTNGELMWQKSEYTIDGQNFSRTASYFRTNSVGYGLFFFHNMLDTRLYAVNMTTGDIEWRSEQKDLPYGAFMSYQMAVGYEKAYVESYDGHIYAYNVADGSTAWAFAARDSGLETPYNTYPFWHAPAVADHKVFASNSEHSAQNPLYRGTRMYAINDTDGTEVWSIGGAWGGKSVGSGTLLVHSESTGELFAFARGPTKTSVTASPKVAVGGSNVLIEGSVYDISPGTQKDDLVFRFPVGVPAVSEDVMSDYMEYLYLERPLPENVEGVSVDLYALDPNGNFLEIGSVTSDRFGMFKKMWQPPVEGEYTIYAAFEGSTSYWPSSAETAIGVTEAPAPSGPIEPEPTALITTEVAIIAAVAVVAVIGVGAYWYLRKRGAQAQ